MTENKDRKILVKCYVDPESHQRIRMAAAANDVTISELVGTAATEEADKILADFQTQISGPAKPANKGRVIFEIIGPTLSERNQHNPS